MIKSLLIGSALLLAASASAQTTGATGTAAGAAGAAVPPATSTTGHADDVNLQATGAPPMANPTNAGTTAPVGLRGTSATAGMAVGATDRTGSAAAYSGTGGPYEPVNYPPCSRTVRDSCTQMGRHRPHH